MNGAKSSASALLRPNNPGLGEPIRWSPDIPVHSSATRAEATFSGATVPVCVNSEIRANRVHATAGAVGGVGGVVGGAGLGWVWVISGV